MNTNRRTIIHLGTSFILVVFILLCLASFAVLSIVNANSDYKLSIKTAEQTTRYYEADKEAKSVLEELKQTLEENYKNTNNSETEQYYIACIKALSNNPKYSINADEKQPVISYSIPIDANQILSVSLKLVYPQAETDSLWQILSWQNTPLGEWEPDENAPVFDGTFPLET